MSVSIEINHVVKKYGESTIVPDLSVEIKNGESFTLLGPSDYGKTTLLRMIAGFNTIEEGKICFDDEIINWIDAHRWNIGMVFQSYTIFPHMMMRKNVGYGLKLRKEPEDFMEKKIDEILSVAQIQEHQDRLPRSLSSGQQQRVALTRAVVIRPSVLLMDEPLSNLDAKLRIEVCSAVREVQHQMGIVTVYVTHNQGEALAISDRIAVMRSGVIQQVDTPERIYSRPANTFVSTFVRHNSSSHATMCKEIGFAGICLADGYRIEMDNLMDEAQSGQRAVVSARPEEFSPQPGARARIAKTTFPGKYIDYVLEFEDSMVLAGQPSIEFTQDLGYSELLYHVGDPIDLKSSAAEINVFTEDREHDLVRTAV